MFIPAFSADWEFCVVLTLGMASITDGKLVNNVVTLNKLILQSGCLNIFFYTYY